MRIDKLSIKNLYGIYDYDVSFNEDITFLFGVNGCGKTTILNILTYIVTGQLYRLFEYDFSELVLCSYHYLEGNKQSHLISIVSEGENEYDKALVINVDDKSESIKYKDYLVIRDNINDNFSSMQRYYSNYQSFNLIKDMFNYVYLPLNRTGSIGNATSSMREMRTRQSLIPTDGHSFHTGFALEKTETIIKENYQRALTKVSAINDDFKIKILKSLLQPDRISENDFLKVLRNSNIKKIDDIYKQTIEILSELKILSVDEKKNYDEFFEAYKIIVKKKSDLTVDDFLKIQEYARIYSLIPLLDEIDNEKKEAMISINLFLNTVNDFIRNNGENKELAFDDNGKLCVKIPCEIHPIPISKLSSGEKQIITFFAYLIFKAEKSTDSIFIVDEPELSLHLQWQSIFVDKIMEVNPKVQLVFATHAPEFIGKRTNKMVELKKQSQCRMD